MCNCVAAVIYVVVLINYANANATWWQRFDMAGIRLEPPEPFDFRQPQSWNQWKRRFDQYRVASGLSTEEDERQACVLLYCLGKDAEDVLSSTNIVDADRKKYKSVIDKLDEHFKVRHKVIFERARFNKRVQRPGETGEEYISALYGLIETCEYTAAVKEEMLRDRLVAGIRDQRLSETLQMNSTLNLETAKKTIRQKEAVKEQQLWLKNGDGSKANPLVIEEVKPSRDQPTHKAKRVGKQKPWKRQSGPDQSKEETTCSRCGRKPGHSRQQCPAKSVTDATQEVTFVLNAGAQEWTQLK